jgi:capsular polysaccharide biosynthesis protein
MLSRNVEFATARYRNYCRDHGKPCWDDFTTVHLPSPYATAPGLREFQDALVLGGEWFVVTRDFTAPDHQALRPAPYFSVYIAGGRADQRLLIHDRPMAVDFEVGFLVSGTHNYAHWLFDRLPLLQFYDRVPAGTPLIVNSTLSRFQVDSLAMLGFGPDVLQPFDFPGAYRVPRLWYPDLAAALYLPPLRMRPEPILWLRDRLARVRSDKVGSRRLYLSRRLTAQMSRRLMNEEDVAAVFERHGFEIVFPETMALAEQIDMFAEATVLAGPHGAGMANAVFAPASCTLLELVGPALDDWYKPDMLYAQLASFLGQPYRRVVGHPPAAPLPPPGFISNEPFVIDLTKLAAVLAAL